MSNFRGIKQRGDYNCTFACIEMCLIYLKEQKITQEDIRNKFHAYFAVSYFYTHLLIKLESPFVKIIFLLN